MTSKFVQDTCLLLRHDGCKKGTYPVKGQGCKPSKRGLGQGGSGSGRGKAFAKGALLGAAGTGALALGGAAAGAAWMNTRHGQRTVGEAQQKLGELGQKASGVLPKKLRAKASNASADFAANGAERYAKNAMTKEEVKQEYDRRLARQEKKSKPRGERSTDRNVKKLEGALSEETSQGLSKNQARRLERMLA